MNYLKVVEIVKKNPGLDGIGLKSRGYRPQNHGSLRDAECAGLLVYRNGGWFYEPCVCVTEPSSFADCPVHGSY